MPNMSATGGYLSPGVVTPPTEDSDLDAQIQPAIVGICGLDGSLVRPRWQANPPKTPEPSVNWCAIGIADIKQDQGPYLEQVAVLTHGYQRHEDITLACTFYGPRAQAYAQTLRDGLAIPQNIEALSAVGIKFIECSSTRAVPELYNQQWLKRYDLTVRLRRQVKRAYSVQTVLSATDVLVTDTIGIISQ